MKLLQARGPETLGTHYGKILASKLKEILVYYGNTQTRVQYLQQLHHNKNGILFVHQVETTFMDFILIVDTKYR